MSPYQPHHVQLLMLMLFSMWKPHAFFFLFFCYTIQKKSYGCIKWQMSHFEDWKRVTNITNGDGSYERRYKAKWQTPLTFYHTLLKQRRCTHSTYRMWCYFYAFHSRNTFFSIYKRLSFHRSRETSLFTITTFQFIIKLQFFLDIYRLYAVFNEINFDYFLFIWIFLIKLLPKYFLWWSNSLGLIWKIFLKNGMWIKFVFV